MGARSGPTVQRSRPGVAPSAAGGCWQGDAVETASGAVRLSDGRWAEFAQFGPRDAPVVLYCHGWPGSRWEIGWAERVLAARPDPVRIIAPNRPGYGRSSWSALPGFRAWADDAAQVLDSLAVERCGILGASGGSPFALACGEQLAERVTRVAVVAGAAPPDTLRSTESGPLRYRRDLGRIRWRFLALLRSAGLSGWQEDRVVHALPQPDRRALRTASARATLHRMASEAFAQAGRAAAHEQRLYQRPWDVSLTRFPLPVRVWHGGADTRVPVAAGEAVAGRLPGAEFTIWPQHGHFSWAAGEAVNEVVDFLIEGASD
jgi:pimeloyl-ACP methyl ester carboxylesterase